MAAVTDSDVVDFFAKEVITPTGTASGFTNATYAPAQQKTAIRAHCRVEGSGTIRYWQTGDNPTASDGILVDPAVNPEFIVCGPNNIRNFRIILASGTPKVAVEYGR